MDTVWFSAPYDRPRCRVIGADGRRCREPVVWEALTDTPVSTRCRAHGGLDDAVLMGRGLSGAPEAAIAQAPAAGGVTVRAAAAAPSRRNGPSRHLTTLAALALVAALSFLSAGPALADFESAVSTYERGAYVEAEAEFRALAAAGDERAEPYLESIRQKLDEGPGPGASVVSAIVDTVKSLFNEPERPNLDTATRDDAGGAWWTPSGLSTRGSAPGKPDDWEPWTPFDRGAEAAPAPAEPEPASYVIAPERYTLWSTIFHLPGDATVVGLQYAAKFLEAETLGRELQSLSRHRDEIALSILAGVWWLLIVRVLVGVGVHASRFIRAAATIGEEKHYG